MTEGLETISKHIPLISAAAVAPSLAGSLHTHGLTEALLGALEAIASSSSVTPSARDAAAARVCNALRLLCNAAPMVEEVNDEGVQLHEVLFTPDCAARV